MATTNIFDAEYEIVKLNPAGTNRVYAYRRGVQRSLVAAANLAGVPAILAADVTLQSGETIEVLSVRSADQPGAGATVLS